VAPTYQYLTVAEIVARTGLGRTLVYELINTRQLEAVHVAATVRVREDVLERFLADHTHKAIADNARRRKAAASE
jgi:excisionase family DNA binding protein